jgi:hypothetical protein
MSAGCGGRGARPPPTTSEVDDVELPETLPERLYLLAYDRARQRLTARDRLGELTRAAALVELEWRGLVADDDGKVSATGTTVGDPVLAGVLADIAAAARPRSWKRWIARGGRHTAAAVRTQLESGGWIRVEQRRILGLFPWTGVTVRDPRVLTRLQGGITRALGGDPVARLDRMDAATTALAAAAKLQTALPRARRRDHRKRIAELTDHTGPAAGALRKVIRDKEAAAASG